MCTKKNNKTTGKYSIYNIYKVVTKKNGFEKDIKCSAVSSYMNEKGLNLVF